MKLLYCRPEVTKYEIWGPNITVISLKSNLKPLYDNRLLMALEKDAAHD